MMKIWGMKEEVRKDKLRRNGFRSSDCTFEPDLNVGCRAQGEIHLVVNQLLKKEGTVHERGVWHGTRRSLGLQL